MNARVSNPCARRGRRALSALLLGAAPWPAMGQLPGLPVFQGAFPAPGLAVGADVGRDAGRTMLAGAVGYGPRSGRFGLVAGAGVFSASAPGFGGSRLAYGARFALRAVQFANARLAITPFAGFGSTRARLTSGTVAGLPATPPDIGKVDRKSVV